MSGVTDAETKKKSYQTRLKIMDAYIALIKKKDFDAITVKAIAEKASVTRGTFYLYFTDIYEMITYIENSLLADMPNTPKTRTGLMNKLQFPSYEACQDNDWERKWFEYYDRNHIYFNTLLGSHGDASFAIKIKKLLQNALRIKMQQDGMQNDDFQNYFIELIPNLYLLLAREWTENAVPGKMDVEAMVQIVNTMRVGSLYLDSLEIRRAANRQEDGEVTQS